MRLQLNFTLDIDYSALSRDIQIISLQAECGDTEFELRQDIDYADTEELIDILCEPGSVFTEALRTCLEQNLLDTDDESTDDD